MEIDLLKRCVMARCSEEALENIIKILEHNNISYKNKEKDYMKICYQVKKIYDSVDWEKDQYGNLSKSAINYRSLVNAIVGIRNSIEFRILIQTL